MALQRFARNTWHSTLAGLSTALGAFVSVVIVARVLGPGGAGNVALGIWLVGVMVTACDLGLPLTVARFLPDLSARKQTADVENFASSFFPALLATTALGAALCAVVWWFRDEIDARFPPLPFDDQPALIWLALGVLFVLQALGNYGQGALRGAQRFDEAARLSSVSFGIQLSCVALGGFLYGAPGAIVGYAGGSLLLAIHALRHVRIGARIDPELRARAWRFSLASWGVGLIAAIVWSRTELAFLNHFRGPQEAGLYSIANTLALVATQGPLLMTGGLLALFSERHAVGDHEGLARAFESAVRFMSFLIFPACFGMGALAPSLVPALFGPAFTAAAEPAAILVAAQAFGAVSAVSTALLFATERNYLLVWTGVFGAVAIIASGLFVIPVHGLMGAVFARSIIQFLIVVASFVYIGRTLECPTPFGSVFRIMLAAAGCAVAARAVVIFVPGWLGIAPAIVAGALVYLGLARLLHALPEDDIGRLRDVSGRMPAWLMPVVTPLVHFLEH